MHASRIASIATRSTILICFALVQPLAIADHNDEGAKSSVNVSFGRGLNTALTAPSPKINHVVLPKEIKVKAGGVVDFGVAGFHDIVIFKPGFRLNDLIDAGGNGEYPLFPPVFVLPPNPLDPVTGPLADKIYYRGINPAGGPLATAPTPNPSNAVNRSEPVTFLEKGTYLVICNVRPHLIDGMYAYVKVHN